MYREALSFPAEDGTGSRQNMHQHILLALQALPDNVNYQVVIRVTGTGMSKRMSAGQSELQVGNGQVLTLSPAPSRNIIVTLERE